MILNSLFNTKHKIEKYQSYIDADIEELFQNKEISADEKAKLLFISDGLFEYIEDNIDEMTDNEMLKKYMISIKVFTCSEKFKSLDMVQLLLRASFTDQEEVDYEIKLDEKLDEEEDDDNDIYPTISYDHYDEPDCGYSRRDEPECGYIPRRSSYQSYC